MPSIEIVRVSPIYPMHDLQEIPLGGFQDEMIMVVHQDIGMNQDTIAIMVILHEAKELYPVPCIKKDSSPLIPTAGNMIQGSRIFNPNSSSHSLYISYPQRYVKFQGLTPLFPLFYVDRNNKEWWHKAFPGASHLSPDGSWVVVAPSGGTGKAVIILNDKEEVVLNKEYYWAGGAEVRFSENSQYVAVMDTRYVYDQNIYWIFDRQGNIVLEFKKEQGDGVKAFAVNGLFSVASMVPESIYNLKGEKIITGHRTTISGDGKVAIKKTRSEVETKLDVIKVAALKTLKSYHMPASSYKRDLLKISFNGRYIVLGPHDVYSSKVIVLDIVKGLFWKVDLVVPHYTIVSEQSPNCPWSRGVFFTKDEKYMVVHVHTIQYYQLR
jgi:hypothetical protein